MKTMQTTRGIEYDLEITEVGTKSIQVQSTCEEGSNTFTIRFPFEIKEDNAFYSQMLDGDISQLTDEDLEEVNAWVDEVTIAFIASESAKLCLDKSSKTEYASFSLFTLNCYLSLNITVMTIDNGSILGRSASHYAYGEQDIKELINKLSK